MIVIVIPVHNRKHLTRNCLISLREQTLQNFTSIVIDDGSTDATGDMIEKEFPEAVLLRGDGNLWWAGATNVGVQYALQLGNTDDYILTLNNDTTFPPNYLEMLHSAAFTHPASLIGSIALSDQDGSMVVDGGVQINWMTAKFVRLGRGKRYKEIVNSEAFLHPVDVLPGRGTLIPIDVFQRIGLYDVERLPHYGADYEFSCRAKMKGYGLFINHKAVVISNVKMTGLNNRVNELKWRDLVKSFFSIRSANNLKYRWNFARLCCGGWRFPVFYACDTGRLILGSLLSQIGLRKRAI